MYLHLGRGNVVRIEDIIAITDFERLTSFKRGQQYIDEFIARDDIENPQEQIFPQSCVFVLKGIEEDEEEQFFRQEEENLSLGEISYLRFKRKRDKEIKEDIKKEAEKFYKEEQNADEKFSKGGEFYLSDEEFFEEERSKGNAKYEKIVGKISFSEEREVDEYIDSKFPDMSYYYQFTPYFKNKRIDKYYFRTEFFNGASLEEIKNILPKYNLYEKCRMVAAFRIHLKNEFGERYVKEIEKKEGIGYILGFGELYLYGKKIYYPENTRLYIYVSEYTPHTLYKRIKEEENLLKYVSKED